MRQLSVRLVAAGVVAIAVFAGTAGPSPSTALAATKKIPTKIVATGTLPPAPEPAFGAPAADGSLPFTATYPMAGDLSGEVRGQGSMTIDTAAHTYSQHDTTGTFIGKLAGVGPVTLEFVTTIPPTGLTEPATESGTATATSGKVKGYQGSIVNHFSIGANGPTGTYTVTLKKQK